MSLKNFSTFVISLPSSERKNILVDQLKDKKLEFTIIQATEGKSLKNFEIRNKFDYSASRARLGYDMSPTLIACAFSHLKTYQYFLTLNTDWALILEEDASLNASFNQITLEKCLLQMPNAPVVLQLFSRSSRLTSKKQFTTIGTDLFLFKFLPRLPGFGAAAYFINRKAAELATSQEKLVGPPDFPNWHTRTYFFGVYPWLVHESASNSTIVENSMSRSGVWIRRLLVLSGLHYLKYRMSYDDFTSYLKEEIIPLFYYLIWKLKGSKFLAGENSPQII